MGRSHSTTQKQFANLARCYGTASEEGRGEGGRTGVRCTCLRMRSCAASTSVTSTANEGLSGAEEEATTAG